MGRSERQLIARVKSLSSYILGRKLAGKSVRIGIGDDCAVLPIPAGSELLVTTDFTLEDVHFRRDWHPPETVGHRCLARGLSDIAAMGGTPLAVFLSLAVPAESDFRGSAIWIRRFLSGLAALAKLHRVELAGGDTAQSHHAICADIVVLGLAPPGKALLRSGARPGDGIYVTGELGGAAATLSALTQGNAKKIRAGAAGNRAHFFPVPRLKVGQYLLAKRIATSAIDISDGLSTDLSHLCEESGVSARLNADAIPIASSARKADNPLELALHGGDDYELLFTASAKVRVPRTIAGVRITRIGEIAPASSPSRRMMLVQGGRATTLKPRGWEHFR